MQLDTDWDFEEALININSHHPPYGYVGPQLRNRQIETWGQMVGRTRALSLFDAAVRKSGSLSAFGKEHSITTKTLRRFRAYFWNLPHVVLTRDRKIF